MRGARVKRTERARALRADPPSAEARLWSRLRNRRLNGFKFVRQEPIGFYFADFCCREEKLVVEVDGATHSTGAERAHDARREATMRLQGYRIVRVNNVEVYENLDGVLETILAALERRETW
jgi:very-short-patch-repair endonuclease